MATLTRLNPESLPNRAVIALTGDGILTFLHNILTCDVEHLAYGGLAYGALLSPQGKILHDIFVHNTGDAVLIDCEKACLDELVAKLKLYRLRAKFAITPRDDVEVAAGAGHHATVWALPTVPK
jgi:tRNA-modifying protein YgfZ